MPSLVHVLAWETALKIKLLLALTVPILLLALLAILDDPETLS